MSATKKQRSPWPIAIASYFGVVIVCIAFFITWAVRQNMDLVRKDYYAEELRYQQQLDRMNNTAAANAHAAITYNANQQTITIELPAAHHGATVAGNIQFYRPSNASEDKTVQLAPAADGTQVIDVKPLSGGHWKVRVFWKTNEREYFTDESIIVAKEG